MKTIDFIIRDVCELDPHLRAGASWHAAGVPLRCYACFRFRRGRAIRDPEDTREGAGTAARTHPPARP